MYARSFLVKIALSGMVFQTGFLTLFPARAQDAPPKEQARPEVHAPVGEKATAPLPGRKGIGFIDPGQSYLLPLLKREDVQAQLFLTPRQREALDALEKNQQQALQQQLSQDLLPSPDELAGKSLKGVRAFFAERAAKRNASLQNLNSVPDPKIAAILTTAQWKRLKELDLQWRGPLAMGVKSVAEQANLTPQQTPLVADLLKQYQQEASRRMRMETRAIRLEQTSGGGEEAANGDVPPSPASAEIQARTEKTSKEVEKIRKTMGEKALNAVAGEQRAQWYALTGKPFVFRNQTAKE